MDNVVNNTKVVVGLDIGYGNVKITYGSSDTAPTTVTLPSNFEEVIDKGDRDFFQKQDGAVIVNDVNGKEYVTFVEHVDYLENFSNNRCIDSTYPKSRQYRLLFRAALATMNLPIIDSLVI